MYSNLLKLLFLSLFGMQVLGSSLSLAPYKYDLLPIGTISPQGWIKSELEQQANGLAGHLFDFYRYVKDSLWVGGTYEYSELHEAAPYWYNGIVPLAYTLRDERLVWQANSFLSYVLEHQADDGWLGPETTKATRGIWARCLLLQGMMNHAIADPAQTEKIVAAMLRFVGLVNEMLKTNYTGFIQQPGDNFDPYGFGTSRAHELSTSLQWLLEEHPQGQQALIWETMALMWSGAVAAKKDWTTFFIEDTFPKVPLVKGNKTSSFMHGVNLAEGLRYMVQQYRMTRNPSLITQTRLAVNMTTTYHGAASGTIIADEYLGGQSSRRGSELCMAVEMIFSMSYLYRFLGDNSFADHAELALFNALPAGISEDWWSHQYVTQTNQPWSRNLTASPFYNVVSYGNVYGLEPNFPCCTVNHGQALPKALMSSWVIAGKSGILHMIIVPSSVNAQVNGASVSITCDTSYPSSSSLSYTITSTGSFTLSVRIPSWASSNSTVSFDSPPSHEKPLMTDSNSIYSYLIHKGVTSLRINLSTSIRVVPKPNNAIAIYRGPLLYALSTPYTVTSTAPLNWTDRTPLPDTATDPRSKDHIITPNDPEFWSIAIDPSQLVFHSSGEDGDTWINAAASKIEWAVVGDTPDLPPSAPVVVGDPFMVQLVPFGKAKLHMAEFPATSLVKINVL